LFVFFDEKESCQASDKGGGGGDEELVSHVRSLTCEPIFCKNFLRLSRDLFFAK
jgi:hypothetical protein